MKRSSKQASRAMMHKPKQWYITAAVLLLLNALILGAYYADVNGLI